VNNKCLPRFRGIAVARPLVTPHLTRTRGLASERVSSRRAANFVRAILLHLIIAAPAVPAAWAQTVCPIPDELALHDIALPAAKQQVTADKRLIVLTFGGVHAAGADAETQGATFPARLEAELSAALPAIKVTVTNEMPPGKNSADVPPVLPDLIAKTGARLVIWGPGGRDVMTKLDLAAFQTAVNAGINAARHAGTDLILLDTTFVPSPPRMAMIEAYRQKLQSAAALNNVPVLRRHDLMRRWSEDGTLNFAASTQSERDQVARHLFACVARSLAVPITAAVR
jgi:acyl-CoA thioesterase-1